MTSPPRVVVTGIGVVSTVGVGVDHFWQALLDGQVGTGSVTLFDTGDYATSVAGQIPDWVSDHYTPAPLVPVGVTPSRSESFAVAAGRLAFQDAGLDRGGLEAAGYRPARCGVITGMVTGNRPAVEATIHRIRGGEDPGPRLPQPVSMSAWPALDLGLRGLVRVLPMACAAGNAAIADGMDLLRSGAADLILAGGADELSEAMFLMFDRLRAFTPDRVRPFDPARRGLILGEGAAYLVLEREEDARRRGAQLYGVVAGHGNFADAHHMTAPHPQGTGATRSIRRALEMAGLGVEDVDHINAHGTGTPANDEVEALVLAQLLGRRARDVPVTALKSGLGHAQGAASALEAAACLLSIRHGIVPPTVNTTACDYDIDLVLGEARRTQVRVALNNSFGFGGNNCCVVLQSAAEPR